MGAMSGGGRKGQAKCEVTQRTVGKSQVLYCEVKCGMVKWVDGDEKSEMMEFAVQ